MIPALLLTAMLAGAWFGSGYLDRSAHPWARRAAFALVTLWCESAIVYGLARLLQ